MSREGCCPLGRVACPLEVAAVFPSGWLPLPVVTWPDLLSLWTDGPPVQGRGFCDLMNLLLSNVEHT